MKRHLLAHGDYTSTANRRTNVPAIFRRVLEVLFGTSTFSIYVIVSYGTPGDVMRYPAGKHRSMVYILNSSRKIPTKGSRCRVGSVVSRLRAG